MIKAGRTLIGKLMLAACLLAGSQPLLAETYEFSGVVTLCTGTCDSFASLALGTEVTGTWEIDTDANGSWGFDDFGDFQAEVFNRSLADQIGEEPWDGTNPTSANPLPLTPAIAAITGTGGIAQPMTTAGTTDADNQLASGTILHEFLVPPFSSNSAWVIFDIGPGGVTLGKVCLFFVNAGCLPGATEAVKIEGTFTLQVLPSDISVDPTAVDFGNLQIGTPASQTVTVTNNGTGDLNISSVNSSGLPAGVTVDASACVGVPVAAGGGTCTISVDVISATVAALSGSFFINSNDPDTATVEVTVNANIVAGEISVSENPLAFDLLDVGGMAQSTITVTNSGEGVLTIGDVAMADPLAAPFAITDACASQTLDPATGTCDITVTFTPTVEGSFRDTFDIVSDDPAAMSLSVEVTGDAAAAQEPRITITPAGTINFGDLLLGQSAQRSFSVRNTGSSVLTISDVFVDGAAAADYTQSNNCATVAPALTCTIDVVFTPTAGGDRLATLNISSDAVNNPALTVSLTASVFAGPRIELSTDALVFGSTEAPVEIGASASASLTVTNTGTSELVVTATNITGTDAAQFAVGNETCSAGAVAPQASCTIAVDFSPLATGDKSAVLSIESTDTDNSPSAVTLTGFVFEGPRAEPSATQLDIIGGDDGEVVIGESASGTFMVLSTGTEPLTVTAITLTNNSLNQFSYESNCLDAPVDAGSGCDVTVTFAPKAVGPQSATLTISADVVAVAFTRGTVPDIVVTVSGVGQAPPQVEPGPPPGSQTVQPPNYALGDVDSDGACFIATAAYGSYLDPQVWVLREFRDQVLLTNDAGRALVKFYYSNSPPVADFIARHEGVRMATRVVLTPLVYALKYPLAALLLLGAMLVTSVLRRRKAQLPIAPA